MNARNMIHGHRSGIIPVIIHPFEFPRAWDSQWLQCPRNGLDVDNQALGYGGTFRVSIQTWLWCRYHFGLARVASDFYRSKKFWLGPLPTANNAQTEPPTPRRYAAYRRLDDPTTPLVVSEVLTATSDDMRIVSEPQLLVIYGPKIIAIPMAGKSCDHKSCTEEGVCNQVLDNLDSKNVWVICNNLVFTNVLICGMSLAFDWGYTTVIALAVSNNLFGAALLLLIWCNVWTARTSLDTEQHQLLRRFTLYVSEVEQAARQLRRTYFDNVNYGYSRPIDILVLNGRAWAWCRAETVPSGENTWLQLNLPTKNFVFALGDFVVALWTFTVHTILPWNWVGLMVNLAYAVVVGSADTCGWGGVLLAFFAVLAIKCILHGFVREGYMLYRWASGDTWVMAWYLILFKAMTNVSVEFLVDALSSWLFPDADVENVVDKVVGDINITNETGK